MDCKLIWCKITAAYFNFLKVELDCQDLHTGCVSLKGYLYFILINDSIKRSNSNVKEIIIAGCRNSFD